MRGTLKSTLMVLLLTGVCSVECAARKHSQFLPDPRFMAIQSISVCPWSTPGRAVKPG